MKLLTVGTNIIHMQNFHELMKNSEIEVLFITDRLNKDIHYESIRIVPFSFRNPFNILKSISLIKEIIHEFQPDIIHIHQAGTHAFLTLMASRKISIPTIVTAWGSDILLVPEMGFLYKRMVAFILQRADFFTSDSSYLAERMKNLMPARPLDITVLNYGIDDLSGFEKKETVFYSNRLHKKLYRIDKIIQGFNKFLKNHENENWKLIIAGEGIETDYLKQLSIKLGIENEVDFVGWLNKESNCKFYRQAAFFVSIPESDATSISLLEAMSAGCIPIVSNLPANLEWIIDGTNGIVVDNLDLDDDFLSQGLGINVAKAINMNHQIIKEHALKDTNRKKFIGLYQKALDRK